MSAVCWGRPWSRRRRLQRMRACTRGRQAALAWAATPMLRGPAGTRSSLQHSGATSRHLGASRLAWKPLWREPWPRPRAAPCRQPRRRSPRRVLRRQRQALQRRPCCYSRRPPRRLLHPARTRRLCQCAARRQAVVWCRVRRRRLSRLRGVQPASLRARAQPHRRLSLGRVQTLAGRATRLRSRRPAAAHGVRPQKRAWQRRPERQ